MIIHVDDHQVDDRRVDDHQVDDRLVVVPVVLTKIYQKNLWKCFYDWLHVKQRLHIQQVFIGPISLRLISFHLFNLSRPVHLRKLNWNIYMFRVWQLF